MYSKYVRCSEVFSYCSIQSLRVGSRHKLGKLSTVSGTESAHIFTLLLMVWYNQNLNSVAAKISGLI